MNHDCQHCDGYWMNSDEGLKRCTHCAKGRDLRAADRARTCPPTAKVEPVLSKAAAQVAVEAMGAISFYPADPAVRAVIRDEIRDLCGTPADAAWLASRMIKLFRRWPGIMDLRIVYASRKIPHDGIMPVGTSEAYPEGIPPEHPAEAARLALPAPSGRICGDPGMEQAVLKIAGAKAMQAPRKEPARVVTQADLDAAMEVNRARRAAKPPATEREPA